MKTHLYLFFVVTVSSVQSATIWNLAMGEWDLFKLEHGKHYNHLEEKFRMLLFIDRKHKINKHNFKYEKGLVSYKLAVNKYADKYHHELVDKLYGYNSTRALKFRENNVNLRGKFNSRANVELPESVNWVEKGAVTRVKDQGNCGSCWAFSSTGSLEGQYFRRTGKLISLSEQNLMDCTYDYDNHGCEGGLMDNAFDYIKDNGGIDNEQNYPYEEEVGPCRYKSEYHEAEDVGLVDIEQGNEKELKFAVATIGPISVAIDASHDSFLYYSKGIYHEPDCSEFDLVHAVLVVGYGTDENGIDYWLVKNSWGEHWGDKGYIKMRRNSNNHCGIATLASYPLV